MADDLGFSQEGLEIFIATIPYIRLRLELLAADAPDAPQMRDRN
jgi:hypothetical protein